MLLKQALLAPVFICVYFLYASVYKILKAGASMSQPSKQYADNKKTILKTPLGYLSISMSDSSVSSVDFLKNKKSIGNLDGALSKKTTKQIENYFQNPKKKFDLPLELNGTPFQKRVWRALQKIPAGEVRTYGQIAKQLKTASQAVGNACRANPVPIIIPCHRVVSATGLGGYMGKVSGKSTDIKQWLLDHEQQA